MILKGSELYNVLVHVKKQKISAKSMKNAADIVHLRKWTIIVCDELELNDRTFVLLIICHMLWTPIRMHYFMDKIIKNIKNIDIQDNNLFQNLILNSLKGVDNNQSEFVKFENRHLRTGLINGQTIEKRVSMLASNIEILIDVSQRLLDQWFTNYNFDELVHIAKSLPFHGNYHATHLIRSLSYSIPNTEVKCDSWQTLSSMSSGVLEMYNNLKTMETNFIASPELFKEKISKDTNQIIEYGDIPLLFCEVKQANLHKKSDIFTVYYQECNDIREKELNQLGLNVDEVYHSAKEVLSKL